MKVIDQVANILKYSSSARNSDKVLMIIYMQKFGLNLSTSQIERFREMPSFETIRRSRQVLQEQGKYPASEAIDKARFEKYKQVRANIIDESPEKLLEQQGYKIHEWGK